MKRLSALLMVTVFLTACGGAGDPNLARGRQLFTEHCTACHSLSPEVVIVGPSLAGIATRATDENLEPREVLRRAILTPQAEIVEGFDNLMPPDFEQKLAEEDLEALLSYLLSLE